MSAKPHFACQKPGLARHLCKRLLSESAVAKKHSFAWPTQTAFSDSPVICDQGVLEHGMGQCFTLVEQKVAKVTFPKAAEAFSHRCTRVQTFAGQSVCMFAAPWLRRGHSDCRHCGEACCRAERKGRSCRFYPASRCILCVLSIVVTRLAAAQVPAGKSVPA